MKTKMKLQKLYRPGQIIDEGWKFEGSFNLDEYPHGPNPWKEQYDHRFSKDKFGLLYRQRVKNKFNRITIFSESGGIFYNDECLSVPEFKTICQSLPIKS